jgi:hypothetical protein
MNLMGGGMQMGGMNMMGGYSGMNMMGGMNMRGGSMMGGMMGNMSGGFGTGGRISTIALQDSLKPIPVVSVEVSGRLDGIMENATGIKGGRNIQVEYEGEFTVLRGTVPNERERRLAEAMLSLEPGVRDIRNDLEIGVVPATPTAPIESVPSGPLRSPRPATRPNP